MDCHFLPIPHPLDKEGAYSCPCKATVPPFLSEIKLKFKYPRGGEPFVAQGSTRKARPDPGAAGGQAQCDARGCEPVGVREVPAPAEVSGGSVPDTGVHG